MVMRPNYVLNYHDPRGWEATNPGWHEHIIVFNNYTNNQFLKKCHTVIKWIYDNVEAPEKHARWIYDERCLRVRFRHQRDSVWFALRWS